MSRETAMAMATTPASTRPVSTATTSHDTARRQQAGGVAALYLALALLAALPYFLLAVAFGLLVIVWFAWIGVVLLRTSTSLVVRDTGR